VDAAIRRRRRVEEERGREERQRVRLEVEARMEAERRQVERALGLPFTGTGSVRQSEHTAFSSQEFEVDRQQRQIGAANVPPLPVNSRAGGAAWAETNQRAGGQMGEDVLGVRPAQPSAMASPVTNGGVIGTPMEQQQQDADRQAEVRLLEAQIIARADSRPPASQSRQTNFYANRRWALENPNAARARQRDLHSRAAAQFIQQLDERRKAISKLCVAFKIDTECSICKDPDKHVDDGGLKLPCSHEFGAACITTWLEKNNTCPFCRKDYRRDLGTLRPQRFRPGQLAFVEPRPAGPNRSVVAPATWNIHPDDEDDDDDEFVTVIPALSASHQGQNTWSARRLRVPLDLTGPMSVPLPGSPPDTDSDSGDSEAEFPFFHGY